MSTETKSYIKEREDALLRYDGEEVARLTKKIKKHMRIDRNKDVMRSVDKDLDVRDRWLGIKGMKNSTNQEHITATTRMETHKHIQKSTRGSNILGRCNMEK